MKYKSIKVVLEVICFLIMTLFLYASVSKLYDHRTFVNDMHNQPFPGWLADVFIYTIPYLELLIVAGLVFEKTRRAALYGSLILMSAFTLYTGIVLLNLFHKIPCSCGGIIKKLTWSQHLLLNMFYVILSFVGLKIHKWLSKNEGTETLALTKS